MIPVEPSSLTFGVFLLFGRFLLRGIFICLYKEQNENEVSKTTIGGNQGKQLTSYVGGFKSHESQAATCSSPGSSRSWLSHPFFEVYRKISRNLLKRHLIVILGLTFTLTGARSLEPRGLFPPTAASAS